MKVGDKVRIKEHVCSVDKCIYTDKTGEVIALYPKTSAVKVGVNGINIVFDETDVEVVA
jgi:hypothetical protein